MNPFHTLISHFSKIHSNIRSMQSSPVSSAPSTCALPLQDFATPESGRFLSGLNCLQRFWVPAKDQIKNPHFAPDDGEDNYDDDDVTTGRWSELRCWPVALTIHTSPSAQFDREPHTFPTGPQGANRFPSFLTRPEMWQQPYSCLETYFCFLNPLQQLAIFPVPCSNSWKP
jgi:hypothetical protein